MTKQHYDAKFSNKLNLKTMQDQRVNFQKSNVIFTMPLAMFTKIEKIIYFVLIYG